MQNLIDELKALKQHQEEVANREFGQIAALVCCLRALVRSADMNPQFHRALQDQQAALAEIAATKGAQSSEAFDRVLKLVLDR